MDNSIPEISRKDFPLDGFKGYEANTATDFVFPGFNFFVELEKILLVI